MPTPVEKLANLTRAVGGPQILVKRDDLTGLAFGGNKTRQLEFILGDALARGADVLIIGAGSQSNFCRQATAAACKAGLEIQLILQHGVKGPERQGNLLLDELMGADITIVNVIRCTSCGHCSANEPINFGPGKASYIIDRWLTRRP